MAVDTRLLAVLLAPVILVQSRRLRRIIPRLPDAAPPWRGSVAGPDPLRLLVLGDSTAAGVGVEAQDDGLPGNLARSLAAELGRGAEWVTMGANGATSRDLIENYLAEASAEAHDVIFLSIGTNDALQLRGARAYARDIRLILRRLRATSPRATILVSSMPAFFRFESLPNPLRWALYLHSQSLESAARTVVKSEPGVIMSPPPPPYTDGFFASDLFHPSAQGYREWVEFALSDAGLVADRS